MLHDVLPSFSVSAKQQRDLLSSLWCFVALPCSFLPLLFSPLQSHITSTQFQLATRLLFPHRNSSFSFFFFYLRSSLFGPFMLQKMESETASHATVQLSSLPLLILCSVLLLERKTVARNRSATAGFFSFFGFLFSSSKLLRFLFALCPLLRFF